MNIPSDLAHTLTFAVEEGTFEGAARRMHLTQSAISQRIATLERLTGQALLVRSRPVRPTPAGEAVMRFSRHVAHLEHDLTAGLGSDGAARASVSLAVNADSLATWLLPTLARVSTEHDITMDLRREDESRTADLLSHGEVVAAVTTRSRPVPGCSVTALGRLTYRAVATPAFVARWLANGTRPEDLARAPVVDFDHHDDLQTRWLDALAPGVTPPRHRVPSSSDFANAIAWGMGWGMLPAPQRAPFGSALVEVGGPELDVTLYWQQWRLPSSTLDVVAQAVRSAAAHHLIRG